MNDDWCCEFDFIKSFYAILPCESNIDILPESLRSENFDEQTGPEAFVVNV